MILLMSDTFENITLVKKANVYFDGQVSSRTIIFADGSKKTLGYMQPGEYEFGTGAPELMEVLGGAMDVKLPGADEWLTVQEGESFNVIGDAKFNVKVNAEGADYCCSYLS
jgi:uncharacterized protein YaiE (UPF0345 family)